MERPILNKELDSKTFRNYYFLKEELVNFYMVWSVKYWRKILNAEIEAYLQKLVQEIAEDKGNIFLHPK